MKRKLNHNHWAYKLHLPLPLRTSFYFLSRKKYIFSEEFAAELSRRRNKTNIPIHCIYDWLSVVVWSMAISFSENVCIFLFRFLLSALFKLRIPLTSSSKKEKKPNPSTKNIHEKWYDVVMRMTTHIRSQWKWGERKIKFTFESRSFLTMIIEIVFSLILRTFDPISIILGRDGFS